MKPDYPLQDLRETAVPRGIDIMHPIFAARASGSEIWDAEGKRYIDLAAGIAVINMGHNHPKVTDAAQKQLQAFNHTCFQVTGYEVYLQLANRLNHLAPGKTPKKTILLTTGAEAVENAVKIARAHTRRSGLVAFTGAFHGRTMMAMALTGKMKPYKTQFGPFPGEVYHVPFPIPYHGVTETDSLAALDTLFRSSISPDAVAAIIIEPVQGEGGFYPASAHFMQALRKICDDNGIVLIVDEIQTGFGRTGKMFAVEHSGIEPDLITVAKALGGGFPLSGVIGKARIMDAVERGGLGGTYAGSPVACAAGLAVLDVIDDEKLCERADIIGRRIRDWAERFRQDNAPCPIGDIRAIGAMVAVELVENADPNRPAAALASQFVTDAAKAGVLVLRCGTRGNVVRFLPPLTISQSILDEGLGILEQILRRLK